MDNVAIIPPRLRQTEVTERLGHWTFSPAASLQRVCLLLGNPSRLG